MSCRPEVLGILLLDSEGTRLATKYTSASAGLSVWLRIKD